jgi:hypothetical protein
MRIFTQYASQKLVYFLNDFTLKLRENDDEEQVCTRAVLLDEGRDKDGYGVGSMGERLFADKLVLRWFEGFGAWSLDSATPSFP